MPGGQLTTTRGSFAPLLSMRIPYSSELWCHCSLQAQLNTLSTLLVWAKQMLGKLYVLKMEEHGAGILVR